MSLEYQRYGRNKTTIINSSYINSGEYRNKFNNITDNKDINRVLYLKAKEMLKHRSGTMFEDMYWVDGNTGEIVASVIDAKEESKIIYPDSVKKAIKNKSNIITLHTHPSSMPPSVADFNSTLKNNYNKSLVLCHNGDIYSYSSNQEISQKLYELYIMEFIEEGYNEREAQLKTLSKIKDNFDVDFWEVK